MEFLISSDGLGHVRNEITEGHPNNTIMILDYLAGKTYSLFPSGKTGIWVGLKNTNAFLGDEQLLKATEPVDDLGEKVIDGHKCRGYKWTIATGYVDLWFGADTGCLVYGESKDFPSTGRNAYWTQRLEKFSDKAMPVEAFRIDGYKITPLP
jgi:hypothetical protein